MLQKIKNLIKKTKNPEVLLFILLLLSSSFLRFTQLGYSHFYGDETKVLYLRKDVAASDFLLDQRKGPIQFVVAWFMEKITGSYAESAIRLPFALAGVLSVAVFYLFVKKLFNWQVAMLASFLFAFNGFYVAFGRTAQYQTFLLLFGILALHCAAGLFTISGSVDGHRRLNRLNLLLLFAGISLGLSFLAHYDAVFFIPPILLIFIKLFKLKQLNWKKLLLYFVLPFLFVTSLFYVPYYANGYAAKNAVNYVTKRVEGKEYAPSNSFYTSKIYNPGYISLFILILALFAFVGPLNWSKIMLFAWFAIPFFAFEFIFLNPGTHIHNYHLPLFIMTGLGFFNLLEILANSKIIVTFMGVVVCASFVISAATYVPLFNFDYPWKVFRPNKAYHLYLYGFPYNRGWDQVRDYLYERTGVRNFDTNDNTALASYYLHKYDYTPAGNNYLAQYYVYVYDNQEFKYPDDVFLANYVKEQDFFVGKSLTLSLYKKAP